MRSRARVHGKAGVHAQLAEHVMPTMGAHPIRHTPCMDLDFLPQLMFSEELGSGYDTRIHLFWIIYCVYWDKLSTMSIFKMVYFERIFQVCFERVLRVYFISTYQIQCIFEGAKNQFTRRVFFLSKLTLTFRMKSPKYVFHCFEGRCIYIYIYI